MGDSTITILQYQGRSGFSEIIDAWYALMKSVSSQCFYHHPAWFSAYFDRPEVREDMIFRCAFDDDRLIAVLPLHFEWRLNGVLRTAKLPDYDGLYMPDMVVSDEVDLQKVWDEMSRPRSSDIKPLWDVFSADEVLGESVIVRSMFSSANDIVTSSVKGRCAFIDVFAYEDILRQLKRKFRGNLSNAKHRLSAESQVEFVSVKDPDLLYPAFEEFVELELSGWKGRPEKIRKKYPRPAAIGLKNSKYLFYRNLVRKFGELDAFQIFLLKVKGKAIGAQLCINLNDVCYVLKTAFDETFGRYSPGHLILDFALQEYSEGETVRRMCLITDYEWFRYWNPKYADYLQIRAFAKTAKGRSAAVMYSLAR